MEVLFSLLAAPGFLVGTLLGVFFAALLYWLAPAGTDTSIGGTLIVALCAGGGLAWELLFHRGAK